MATALQNTAPPGIRHDGVRVRHHRTSSNIAATTSAAARNPALDRKGITNSESAASASAIANRLR
jgi:hypothetical protein